MAVVTEVVLGKISGTVGDEVVKQRNGKTIICRKPQRPYNRKNDQNCIGPRNRFRQTLSFATFNAKIPLLRKIWDASSVQANCTYLKLMKCNMNNAAEHHLTENNVISPPGLNLEVKSASITTASINAHLEIKDEPLSTPIQAVAVIYSYNTEGNKIGIRLFAVIQEVLDSDDGREFNISFSPDPEDIAAMCSYQNWIMYFTLIKDDPSGLIWTSTAAVSGSSGLHENPGSFSLNDESLSFIFNRFLSSN